MRVLLLALLTLLAVRQQAVTRKYCLVGFSEMLHMPNYTQRFVRFQQGGEYCLTLNTPRPGAFRIAGTGRKGVFSKTHAKPTRDPHDPQTMLPMTSTDTYWVMEPTTHHGSFLIEGDSLFLSFNGGEWDWADTALAISPDGKTLSMHATFGMGSMRDSRWVAVAPSAGDSLPVRESREIPPNEEKIYSLNDVNEKPERLSGPLPVYPQLLQQAQIEGTVMVQAIIDTLGHVEPDSLRIVQTANPGFNESAKQAVLHSLFRPARVMGKAVRVLIHIPISYAIKGAQGSSGAVNGSARDSVSDQSAAGGQAMTEGIDFPYPNYLQNIVTQVLQRWQRPIESSPLEAEVSFMVHRDGSVTDLQFVRRSGDFGFDLEAQSAIEEASRVRALGSLPDGWTPDVLFVRFYFSGKRQ